MLVKNIVHYAKFIWNSTNDFKVSFIQHRFLKHILNIIAVFTAEQNLKTLALFELYNR